MRGVKKTSSDALTQDTLTLVGANIKWLRKQRGWTQEALAEKAGINDKEVGHIENGYRNITLNTLCKISIALKVTPETLMQDLTP